MSIDTLVVDLADYEPPAAAFGAVVSIFAHLPSRVRGRLNRLLERSLRPGGLFLLEAYRPEQLGRGTGGPADVDMLVSRAALEAELPECEVLLAREIEREVVEGRFHRRGLRGPVHRQEEVARHGAGVGMRRISGMRAVYSRAGSALAGWPGQVSVDRGTS